MNSWYHIQNVTGRGATPEVFIDDEIGEFGIPARRFLNDLKAVAHGPVNLHINSPGGSLIDAFAIYDFVKLQGYDITAYISGIAASAATIVSAAANKVYMGEHSYFFVHNPFFSNGYSGPQTDLDKMKADILDIYERRTGLARAHLSALMDAETLLNGKEAMELGFVDGLVPESKVAARLGNHWDKLPETVKEQLSGGGQPLGKVWQALKEAERWMVQRLGGPATEEHSIHNHKNNPINMEQNQGAATTDQNEVADKLNLLLGRLDELLDQLGDEGRLPGKPAEKDKQIQNLSRELQRIKAQRLDTGQAAVDTDPEAEELSANGGWNYVSRFLQNRFR